MWDTYKSSTLKAIKKYKKTIVFTSGDVGALTSVRTRGDGRRDGEAERMKLNVDMRGLSSGPHVTSGAETILIPRVQGW